MNLKIIKVKEKDIKKFIENEWKKFNKEIGYSWKPQDLFYAAYTGKKIVGYFRCRILGGVAELKELLVSKEFRKCGIGSELIEKFEEIAKEKGCFKTKLITSSKQKTLDFYRKKGYKIEAKLKDDLFHFDWYWFAKKLK